MSIFPKSERKILELIYHNPGIRLSGLMKDARVSAATAKKRLDCLLEYGIISEESIRGGKRVIIRRFHPNFKSEDGKNVFALLESEKKNEFFRKNRNLAGPFRQLISNVGEGIEVIMIFGSFASQSQTRDSDLDLLLLAAGKTDTNALRKEIERSFVTFDHDVSPRIETVQGFIKKIESGISQSILTNHVIVKGSSAYIGMLAAL